jgi:hypothetical protein
MSRSKSLFATANTTASGIATSASRSDPTSHGFRYRKSGISVAQHKSGASSMASAQPVEIRPKNRPMNNRPNKPTTPTPRIAGTPTSAVATERFEISLAPMVVATIVAVKGKAAAPPLM